jgi:hypothetical protein
MLASRVAWAVLILAIGTVAALLFGNQYPGCLGPIGVTHVECIEITGIAPTVYWRPTIAIVAVTAALLVIRPVSRDRWSVSAIAGIFGAIVGAGIHLVTRERTVTGPTSTGETISLLLPVDPYAFLAAALMGAVILALVVGWMPRSMRDAKSA